MTARPKSQWLSPDALRASVEAHPEWTTRQHADALGKSYAQVVFGARRIGATLPHARSGISPALLPACEQALRDGLTAREAAAKTGASIHTARLASRRLRAAGFVTKRQSDPRPALRGSKSRAAAAQAIAGEMSMVAAAKAHHVSRQAVHQALEAAGYTRRVVWELRP
jgi:DNA-binding transcriptional regulator YhcF (GntR family)